MLGLTYAALQWISPNNEETNVKLSVSKSLENFIVYVQGNSILSTSNQKLEQGTDYTSGISATIEFYKKDTNKPIYGRINMEILNMLSATNTTEANISKTNTVKWAITTYTSTNSTETLLNSGTFYGKQINDKFPLYQDFELSTTRTFFKIYIWFDENELDLDKSISNELLSTEISAEASDTVGEYSFPNSPDLVQGLIPVVYDESTSNWVKADSTNTDNSWYNYSDKRWANAVLVKEANFDYPTTSKNVNISNGSGDGIYSSTNQNINNSTSTSTFTITTGSTAGTLSFDYAVSSESNYDKLTITVNGTTVANAISGEKSDTYSVSATANTTYTIIAKYVKDSSQSKGTDTATISNLTYPSGSTLSITPDATYPFRESFNQKIGSNFKYDTSTSKYVLSDTTNTAISNSTVGKYICPDITQDTCSTMYKVTAASTTITKVEEYGTPTTYAVRTKYQSAETGTVLNEEDILAFYVWIPRYKYKVWNISKQAGAESTYAYNAKTEGIDIEWETGKASTGTISCTYNYNVDSANGGVDLSTTTAETCTGSNGDYYTHPTFTFGNDELRGFWISKFEISSSSPSETNGGGNVTNLTVRSLPNVNSWRYNTVSNFSTVIQNMQTSSNIYGLNTSRTNADSHMLTNYEWGAVAYLTNSKYGRCTDGSCTEVTINNCDTYVTGIGANSVSANSSSTTCTTAANKYDGTYGKLASTTGNITGVYDMSGGANEYVMGNISSVTTGYTFYPVSSGFASSWYTTSTAKYVTTYAYDKINYYNQTAYNRGRLGDATAEVVFSTGGSGGWYSDYAHFPYSSAAWFIRGSNYNLGSGTGVFYFYYYHGISSINYSSRATLVSLSA